jgi:hypothetical protein
MIPSIAALTAANVIRFHQAGTVSGWVEIDGTRQEVNPDEWFGFRDRSWGIREHVGLDPTDLVPTISARPAAAPAATRRAPPITSTGWSLKSIAPTTRAMTWLVTFAILAAKAHRNFSAATSTRATVARSLCCSFIPRWIIANPIAAPCAAGSLP